MRRLFFLTLGLSLFFTDIHASRTGYIVDLATQNKLIKNLVAIARGLEEMKQAPLRKKQKKEIAAQKKLLEQVKKEYAVWSKVCLLSSSCIALTGTLVGIGFLTGIIKINKQALL